MAWDKLVWKTVPGNSGAAHESGGCKAEHPNGKWNAFINIPFGHLPAPAQLLIIILFSLHSPQSGFGYISSYPLNKQLGNQILEASFLWSVQGKSREGWSGGSREIGQPGMLKVPLPLAGTGWDLRSPLSFCDDSVIDHLKTLAWHCQPEQTFHEDASIPFARGMGTPVLQLWILNCLLGSLRWRDIHWLKLQCISSRFFMGWCPSPRGRERVNFMLRALQRKWCC